MEKSSIYFLHFVNSLQMVMILILLPSISGMCGKPPPTENAKPKDANLEAYPANSEVFYECDNGYVRHRGSGKSVCQLIGRTYSWTYPDMACLPVQCPAPQQPENGRIINTDFTFGKTVEFECNTGHIMYSADRTSQLLQTPKKLCLANKTWDGETPVCLPVECLNPESVSYSDLVVTHIFYGGKSTYTCHEGYYLHSGDLERRCLANGTWSGELPRCEEIKCEDPFSEEFRTNHITVKTTPFDGIDPRYEVLFECTNQVHSFRSVCKENGNWEPSPPSCEGNSKTVPTFNHHPDLKSTAVVGEPKETAAVYNGENGLIFTGNNMNSTTDSLSSNNAGLPLWAIIIIIAVLVAISCAAVVTLLYKRRKSQKSPFSIQDF